MHFPTLDAALDWADTLPLTEQARVGLPQLREKALAFAQRYGTLTQTAGGSDFYGGHSAQDAIAAGDPNGRDCPPFWYAYLRFTFGGGPNERHYIHHFKLSGPPKAAAPAG